ncbi:helix-turn-helix transcriptional regulator [Thermus filiformis]|uniref:DNA-binding protein n=1 Tax=Thermus filiformis TaxID=276 RepID=A0A0A2WRC5_THEFI|nr:transcriptional regulator [Thermus filiformis]KGQ21317.1 DNA-binding protein [Thermus filiformis]
MGERNRKKSTRLTELRELLEAKPYTTAELAKRFGVSQRTVERDLKDLEDMGCGVRMEGNAYYIPHPSGVDPYGLLLRYAAFRFFFHQAPTRHDYFLKEMRRLLHDLPQHIRRLAVEELDAYRDQVHGQDRVLEYVLRAWQDRRVLRVKYRDAKGKTSWRELEIWFLEVNRWNLAFYALARIHGSRQPGPSVYKLVRMSEPSLLEETYEIPEDFHPGNLLRGAWGVTLGHRRARVVLRFSKEVAWRLKEEDLPPPVSREDLPDGGLEVVYEVNTDLQGYPFELLGWVLSWGRHVEVVSPQDLRARWLEEIQAMAQALPTLPVAQGG